jgi:hypothetical protein
LVLPQYRRLPTPAIVVLIIGFGTFGLIHASKLSGLVIGRAAFVSGVVMMLAVAELEKRKDRAVSVDPAIAPG